MEYIIIYTIIIIFGIITGSFLNVCIYRIPEKEDIIKKRSHCKSCGNVLKWYELIPLFSYLMQGGRCRHCGNKVSIQYPLVEAANGICYVWIVLVTGFSPESILYCLCASVLLVISLVDIRSFEIPVGCNFLILLLGICRMVLDLSNWHQYVLGFFAVSGFFYVIYLVTKGNGIGGGDIKLLAAAGLLLGWQKIILAGVLGCILGSVIHIVFMKARKKERVLAFGPYLAMGILTAMLYGDRIITFYLSFFR